MTNKSYEQKRNLQTKEHSVLERLVTEEGIKSLPCGIYYKVLQAGEGKTSPTVRSIVTVHYRGTFIDGKEFDNSYKRSYPEAFRLCDVIDGWQLALQQMHEGDKWMIYIPYELGYGSKACAGIPAFSTLVFEVELIKIA